MDSDSPFLRPYPISIVCDPSFTDLLPFIPGNPFSMDSVEAGLFEEVVDWCGGNSCMTEHHLDGMQMVSEKRIPRFGQLERSSVSNF